MSGMPAGMAGLLATKYGIMQQEANTHAAAQAALAPLNAAEAQRAREMAKVVAPTSAAQIGLTNAQTGLVGEHTVEAKNWNQVPTSGSQLGMLAENRTMTTPSIGQPARLSAGLGLPPSVPRDSSASMPAYPALGIPGGVTNPRFDPTNPLSNMVTYPPKPVQGYKKGTARVPGKGDGTKDTVNAKLAPGEAVLNKPAAEHIGRGMIAALNAMGAHKMGMVPGEGEGYATGIEEVPDPNAPPQAQINGGYSPRVEPPKTGGQDLGERLWKLVPETDPEKQKRLAPRR